VRDKNLDARNGIIAEPECPKDSEVGPGVEQRARLLARARKVQNRKSSCILKSYSEPHGD